MSLDKILGSMLEKKERGLDVIDEALTREEDDGKWKEPLPNFSVSQLFYCPRTAFLTRAGVPRKIDPVSSRKMTFGTFLHGKIQGALKNITGYGYVEETLSVPKLSIRGHIDGAIPSEGHLVEIKSMSSAQATKAGRMGMPDYYSSQANLYVALWNMLHEEKLSSIWYIVLNRDSMQWAPLEPVSQDIKLQKSILKDLRGYVKMWENGQLPPMKPNCAKCNDFGMCKQVSSLEDVLVGGKVRIKYESK